MEALILLVSMSNDILADSPLLVSLTPASSHHVVCRKLRQGRCQSLSRTETFMLVSELMGLGLTLNSGSVLTAWRCTGEWVRGSEAVTALVEVFELLR